MPTKKYWKANPTLASVYIDRLGWECFKGFFGMVVVVKDFWLVQKNFVRTQIVVPNLGTEWSYRYVCNSRLENVSVGTAPVGKRYFRTKEKPTPTGI